MPKLERLAADDDARAHAVRRFERELPPYGSANGTGADKANMLPPFDTHDIPPHLAAEMEPPLTDHELRGVAFELAACLLPQHQYKREEDVERSRIERSLPYWDNKALHRKDNKIIDVIVRHNIKRRWEKLGVWNPAWGVPSRDLEPEDNTDTWKWSWQQCDSSQGATARRETPSEAALSLRPLVQRTVRLRQNFRRGEHSSVLPQSRLKADASESRAESFLTSRPWFLYDVENHEEYERWLRLCPRGRPANHDMDRQVQNWWRERGHPFRPESWKWPHESRSPSPEALSPIEQMRLGQLNAHAMEFTPSEVDALESIPSLAPAPAPEPVSGRGPRPTDIFAPHSPGEQKQRSQSDPYATEPISPEVDSLESVPPRMPPGLESSSRSNPPGSDPADFFENAGNLKAAQAGAQADAASNAASDADLFPSIHAPHVSLGASQLRFSPDLGLEAHHGEGEQERNHDASPSPMFRHSASSPPPPSLTSLQRKSRPQPQDQTDPEQDPEPAQPRQQEEAEQQPRNRAKMAARKRAAEPLSSDTAPNKKHKRGAVASGAASGNHSTQTREPSGGKIGRGRGRPRKEAKEPQPLSAVSQTPVRKRGPGRPRKEDQLGLPADTSTAPARGPGRPRKEAKEVPLPAAVSQASVPKRGPGRPRKEEGPQPSAGAPKSSARGPGRPRKDVTEGLQPAAVSQTSVLKRGPGRPKKEERPRLPEETSKAPARGPGRPRKEAQEPHPPAAVSDPPVRGRGRPRKEEKESHAPADALKTPARRPGRPRKEAKDPDPPAEISKPPARGRGRPRKEEKGACFAHEHLDDASAQAWAPEKGRDVLASTARALKALARAMSLGG